MVYLASTAAHSVAEVLQRFRGKPLGDAHLLRPDRRDPSVLHRLALSPVRLVRHVEDALLDLDRPETLAAFGVPPSRLAHHDRAVTQRIARRVHEDERGYPGFEWWSALTGAWRSTVLFLDRVGTAEIRYGTPELLTPEHPAVVEARKFLRME